MPRTTSPVLRVDGLDARPLRLVEPDSGDPVAILGYPGNDSLSAAAGKDRARPARS